MSGRASRVRSRTAQFCRQQPLPPRRTAPVLPPWAWQRQRVDASGQTGQVTAIVRRVPSAVTNRLLTVLMLLAISACGDDGDGSLGSGGCGPNENCTTTSHTLGPTDPGLRLLVCLDAAATADDRQALFDRVSIPSATGVGTDLVSGVISVEARPHGIAIELSPSMTTDQRDDLEGVLAKDPVVSVTESSGDCGSQ